MGLFHNKPHTTQTTAAPLHRKALIKPQHIAITLLLVVSCQISSQDPIPDYWSTNKKEETLENRHRKAHHIQSISHYPINCQNLPTHQPDPDSLKAPHSIHTFDTEGKLTEVRSFSPSQHLQAREEHAYDSIGNKISIKHYNRYNELSEIEQFDEQGYRILWLRFAARGKVHKKITQITYNEDSYIQASQTFDQKKQKLSESSYTYHPDHVLKAEIHLYYYTQVPRLGERKRIRKTYNTEAQLIEAYTATPQDTTLLNYIYRYNTQGMIEERLEMNPQQQPLSIQQCTYSSDQQLQRKLHQWINKKGIPYKQELTTYNSQQKPGLIIHTDSTDQEILREDYHYNAQGLLQTLHQHTPTTKHCLTYQYTFYTLNP